MTDRALFITADAPISALATNRRQFSSDITALLDTNALRSEYFVLGWNQLSQGLESQLSITAVEDGTEVTFTPRNALSGLAAGVAHTVTLNAGESLGLQGTDVSGTEVAATAPVAVFAGVRCGNVPTNVPACDHVITQQFGVEDFATEFLMPRSPRAGVDADLIRVIAATDDAEVFVDGISRGTIDRGDFLTTDGVGNARITATNPVQLGQYMRGTGGGRTLGDPAMTIVPGTDQWLDSYVFAVPTVGDEADFAENYLMIVISEGAAASLRVNEELVEDGDINDREIIDGFVYGNIEIGGGVGTASADEPFLAMIAGLDDFVSYLATVATRFAAGASPAPDTAPAPVILRAAPLYEALPRMMADLSHVGSMRQHLGARVASSGGDGLTLSTQGTTGIAEPSDTGIVWMTAALERQRFQSRDFALGTSGRQSVSTLQLGYDLPSIVTDFGHIRLGAFAEYKDASSRINSIFGAAGIKTKAYGIGASATWMGAGGTYVDVVGFHQRFRNKIDLIEDTQRGHSTSISVELGHEISLGERLSITPQAQLSVASLSLKDIMGPTGEEVEFRRLRSTQGRIGTVLDYRADAASGENFDLFLSADLIREVSFSPKVDVTLGDMTSTLEPRRKRNRLEMGVGGQVDLTSNARMGAALYTTYSLQGKNRLDAARGQISLDLKW